ncbi:MAG: ABC transporter ATP-binding protein [Alphaproteobacteria bacterium]
MTSVQGSIVSHFLVLLRDVLAFGRHRLWLGVVLSAAVAGLEGAGLVLLAPMLVASGIDGGSAQGAWRSVLAESRETLGLSGLLGIWVAVVAGHALAVAYRETRLVRFHQDYASRRRARLHAAIVGMEWAAFQRERASDLISALSVTVGRVGFGVSNLVQAFSSLLLVLVHGFVALVLVPGAATLAGIAAILLAVMVLPRLAGLFRHGQSLEVRSRTLHAIATEHLSGMKLAKSHNAEAGFIAAFAHDTAALARESVLLARRQATASAFQKISAALVMVMVVWSAVEVLHLGGTDLLVLLAVFARLMPVLGHGLQAVQRVVEMLPAHVEMETVEQRCLAAATLPGTETGTGPEVELPRGPLVFDKVGYTWAGRDRPAVADIDLVVEENRTTALVGPSGAGKSTLADLALGLILPQEGQVRVGSVALTGAWRAAWRHRAAYVPQDVFLFHDTIRANLAWARSGVDEAALWRALDMAAAAEMVRGLPRGLDSVVGDRGTRLSGGERQRLALARALIREPSFLVLDEATSHLDRDNERLIQEALDRLQGRLTVLIIAHRLATIRRADTILLVEEGHVQGRGSWESLGLKDSLPTAL